MSAYHSLRWKVATAVSILLLTVAAVIAVALVRYGRFHLLEEGNKRALSLAETLAVSARDPLLEADELRLGPVIQSIAQAPDVVYAFVIDHEGVIAFHPDTQLIGTKMTASAIASADDVVRATVPVAVEGVAVGTAFVGLSAAFVGQATADTAKALLLRLVAGTLLGLVGILLLTDFHLRRIARLERAVQRLGEGDLTVKASVRGRDELARLADGFNSMVERLQTARDEVEKGVTETVSALASTIEVNDSYTRGHCERVAAGTVVIAERLGVGAGELRQFGLAALLHDIGKIGVPTHVLAKKGSLTKSEARQMQEHAALGASILSSVSFLAGVSRFVRHHHENWDGTGYPDALRGGEIPLAAQIIHVVDAYDAMTSSRPYRSYLSHEEAMRRIAEARGTQFAPRVVDALVDLVNEGAIGAVRRQVEEVVAV